MKKFILALCFFSLLQCKKKEYLKPITKTINKEIALNDSFVEKKTWHLKDIIIDSIPGISYNRALNSILKNKKGEPTIIAVLDTKIDINHEAIKKSIWINENEIANNNIDDDGNGYIDDINGWNFLGNKKGESVIIENYEYTRIVREYQNIFENAKKIDTTNREYINYKKAKLYYDKKIISYNKRYPKVNELMATYYEARAALKDYFPNYEYSYDVLNKIDTVGNGLSKYVKRIKRLLDYRDFDENIERNYVSFLNTYNKKLNINYFPRKLIGDNPNDLKDSIYGNNKISDYLNIITHGTRVTGFVSNIINNIKLMPIIIVPEGGSTQNKDIVMGIKYAIKNGAKVINMSFGGDFSRHPEWLKEALIYAEKHNVLIVSSTGNGGKNIDNFYGYPNDNNGNEKEFCDNFLYVGASSRYVDSSLVSYSNYSKINVDVFAPGEDVYTTYPQQDYRFDSGTSLSCALTSGVAALLFSHYPNLTASQVKHIIMDSGIEYTIPIHVPTKDNKNRKLPFNQLSKSGKIVNAYNALIMADSISKKSTKP